MKTIAIISLVAMYVVFIITIYRLGYVDMFINKLFYKDYLFWLLIISILCCVGMILLEWYWIAVVYSIYYVLSGLYFNLITLK
jgi:hypothetical protein